MHSTTSKERITPAEWEWVHGLIQDVHLDEKRESETRERFCRTLHEWGVAVRQFQKMELKTMVLNEPDEVDLHFHGLCLHLLLAAGHGFILRAKPFGPQELAVVGVRMEEITATIYMLKISLNEWHHEMSAERVAELQTRVFGAAA